MLHKEKCTDLERKLIERIRENEDAKQIVEEFIFGSPIPTVPQEPSDVLETSP